MCFVRINGTQAGPDSTKYTLSSKTILYTPSITCCCLALFQALFGKNLNSPIKHLREVKVYVLLVTLSRGFVPAARRIVQDTCVPKERSSGCLCRVSACYLLILGMITDCPQKQAKKTAYTLEIIWISDSDNDFHSESTCPLPGG